MRPGLALIGLFFIGSGVALGAEGDLAPIRLRYERKAGAEACPDEAQLRDAIATRLGSDPFSEQGKRLLEITVGPQGEGLQARIALVGETGATTGQRDLRSKSRECHDLATVLVLTATMVLDPLPASAPSAAPIDAEATRAAAAALAEETVGQAASTANAPREAETVSATAAAPTEHTPSVSSIEAGIAVAGEVGSVSSPSLGLALHVGYDWSLFSIALEAQAILPVHQELSATSSVASSQLTGTLVPCINRWHFGGCALISAGATRVTATGLNPPGNHEQPFFGLGARVYGGLPLTDWLDARLLLDLLVPLTQTSIVLDQTTTWTAPPVSGSLAMALVTRFR